MEEIFKNSRYKSILAIFCAFGWSLAYPLIKIGYQEFQIGSADLGVIFAALLLKEELKWQYFIAVMMVACGIYLVNMKENR